MTSKLDLALTRDVPGIDDVTPQERICIELHTMHVALENEIHRLCAISMGKETPAYNLIAGECHHVSHDLMRIQTLHGTKAQAGVVRNLIMRLQTAELWKLPESAVITDHEWIHA